MSYEEKIDSTQGDLAQGDKTLKKDTEQEVLEQERKQAWELYEQRANDLRQLSNEIGIELKENETFPGEKAFEAMMTLFISRPNTIEPEVEGLLIDLKLMGDRFEKLYKEGTNKEEKDKGEERSKSGVIKVISTLHDTIGGIFKRNVSQGKTISSEEFINNFTQEMRERCQKALINAESNINKYKSGEYYKKSEEKDDGGLAYF